MKDDTAGSHYRKHGGSGYGSARGNHHKRRTSTPIVIGIIIVLLLGAGTGVFFALSGGAIGYMAQPLHLFDSVPGPATPPGGALAQQPGYVVTLDTSAYPRATVDPAKVTPEKDTPVTHLPYAQLEGMRFTGWYTAPEGDEAAVRVDNASLDAVPTNSDTTLYARFEPKPTTVDYGVNGLPILMYHYFYDPSLGEYGEDGNHMDIHEFEGHLAYLRDNNYYFPTWEEVSEYIRGNILLPEHSVVLTSDDGHESFYRLAAPLVLQYDAKITSFVVAIDFDPAHLKEFDPTRVFFQSHSYDMHRVGWDGDARLLTATPEEIAEDVRLGAEVLGTKAVYCYPFGKYNDTARQALAANGVSLGLAIENMWAYPMMDPLAVPRVRMSAGGTIEGFISSVN